MTLFLTLFLAGILTILLPCILPLIPIVLGVSIAGRSKWRPLLTVLGMVVSFVGFTFLLFVVLGQFVEVADYMRIATYYLLLLFGIGFAVHDRVMALTLSVFGAIFFWDKGPVAVSVAAALGVIAMYMGGRIASSIQSFGAKIQQSARTEFGADAPFTAFLMGLTMGLVWVPCAGPALSFALTLVRDEPGPLAFLYLSAYALGTAVPLLLIGYGGQYAVHSVRKLSQYSGAVKNFSGYLLIFTALAFQFQWFTTIQTFITEHTSFGTIGTDIEQKLFGDQVGEEIMPTDNGLRSPETMPNGSSLPRLARAPEFTGLGPWHSSEPFTMAQLKGKVVLVDFWTYSCINCIRTLPYIQQYWEKYGVTKADGSIDLEKTPFVLIGVHSPEFVFEKSEKNVADAIEKYKLTYPVAQDNDFGTWKAFANRYWPAKYLIDSEGYVRYEHFGEGGYDETDEAISSLLEEIGVESKVNTTIPEETRTERRAQTPELYVGERSWPAFANAQGDPSYEQITYSAPEDLPTSTYGLEGVWQLSADGERQFLVSNDGTVHLNFVGSEANLVLGLEEGAKPVAAEVLMDGKVTKTFTVSSDDLYVLYKGEYGEHRLSLRLKGAGVAAYAFTFGSM